LKPVTIILLVLLVLAALVVFVLVSSPEEVNSPVDDFTDDLNTITPNGGAGEVTPQELIPQEPIDPNIYCEDFSCFSNNFSTCNENVVFDSNNTIEYLSDGTKYFYSVEYKVNGLNEQNQCLVSVKLLDHNRSFLDSKRQGYLADGTYTEEGVDELEAMLNQSSLHLISKEGSCALDASNPDFVTTEINFMKNLMASYQNCSGELFAQEEGITPFYIYFN